MIEPQARPAFLEIDLTSEQGIALSRSVSDRYGPEIVRAASLASRMFLLRSPWAPGLRFIGAETKSRLLNGDGSAQASFSLSGSGEGLEEAFVSCVGEGIDRLAQIECPDDVTVIASLPEIADRVMPSAIAAIEQDMVGQALCKATPLAWVSGKLLDSGPDLDGDRSVLLPADWCLRRTAGELCLKPRTALSVGVAAGPNFEWAASRALLELIERDAASLWWMGGRRGKAVPLDEPAMVKIARLVEHLRQQTNDRISWLLDITTDIGVPVIVALSCDRDGRQLAYGLAARLSIAEAARAAILELCQTELAILLAKIKRLENGEEGLLPTDRAHLEREPRSNGEPREAQLGDLRARSVVALEHGLREVVLHRGAMALRLRRPVPDAAEALIDDQLRGHVVVEEPLVKFERVGERHALIGGAVLNERRRLGLLDVGDR